MPCRSYVNHPLKLDEFTVMVLPDRSNAAEPSLKGQGRQRRGRKGWVIEKNVLNYIVKSKNWLRG